MNRSIVEIIKTLCQDNNISIGELEKQLGFSQGLISRWEKNSPSVDKVITVANFFQVSTDYLLGREQEKKSIKLEDNFIDKLISETKKYNLNWKDYSQQFIDNINLNEIFLDLYYIIDDNKILEQIEYAYELEYNSSCIYLICAEYNYEFSVFLIMQINKNITQTKDNFVPISTENDFNKTKKLEHEVALYLKTNKVIDKSRMIMRNFLNNSISDLPEEPIPYSHIANNCLVNLPGFVLDARQGTFIMNEISKIWDVIHLLQENK